MIDNIHASQGSNNEVEDEIVHFPVGFQILTLLHTAYGN